MGRRSGRQLQPGWRTTHRVSAVRRLRSGQLSVIDVNAFTSWVAAVGAEGRAGIESGLAADSYTPQAGTESGFLYERFRPEIPDRLRRLACDEPEDQPVRASTPFAMPEYRVADDERASELEAQAEKLSGVARQANQRGDNYVLMTIMFALVLVLVGIGTKMDTVKARTFLFVLATVALAAAAVVVLTFPVEI